jgi:4a-hydroxytetrahydrobiopterin dehydratase
MKRLTTLQIKNRLKSIGGWKIQNKKLAKEFKFENFSQSLKFVNQVGKLADNQDHHLDIILKYSSVKIILSTHSVKGLTEKDFNLAKSINNL